MDQSNRLHSTFVMLVTCMLLAMSWSNQTWAGSPEGEILFQLGKLHHDGEGVPKDFVLARAYYEQAASLGSSDAKLNLGYLYFVGEGVERDFVKARSWYEKAADSGNAAATKNLDFMNRKALGLTVSPPPPSHPIVLHQNAPEPTPSPNSSTPSASTNIEISQPRDIKPPPTPIAKDSDGTINKTAGKKAKKASDQASKVIEANENLSKSTENGSKHRNPDSPASVSTRTEGPFKWLAKNLVMSFHTSGPGR